MRRLNASLCFGLLGLAVLVLGVAPRAEGLGQCTTADPCSLDCVCKAVQVSLYASTCNASDEIDISFWTEWPLNNPPTIYTLEPDCTADTQELEALRLYRVDCSDWSRTLLNTWSGIELVLGCLGGQEYTYPDTPGNGSWTYEVEVVGMENCSSGSVTYCTVPFVNQQAQRICRQCN